MSNLTTQNQKYGKEEMSIMLLGTNIYYSKLPNIKSAPMNNTMDKLSIGVSNTIDCQKTQILPLNHVTSTCTHSSNPRVREIILV